MENSPVHTIKKVLYVGDYHCQVSNLRDSESLMGFVLEKAKEEKVDTIIFLGDQYHTHAVLRLEVLGFWHRKLRLLNKICPTFLLVGNHDMKGDNESTAEHINSMISFDSENTTLQNIYIVDKPMAVGPIGMVPYFKKEEDLLNACQDLYQQGATGCLIAHQTFTGAQYENGFFSEEGVDPGLIPQTDLISGHIHKTQQVGKCFYPGTPKWDTMSDANQPKGLYIIEHSPDGSIASKQFFSTEHIVTPIKTYEVKEGEELPELNPDARNYVILEGKSAWINKMKKKLKNMANIKVKPTDRITKINKENSATLEKYLETEFQPIEGITKEDLKQFVSNL